MIFEVVYKNEIIKRFDISQDIWSQFGIQDKNTRKKLVLFEVEHIDDPVKLRLQ